MSRHYFNWKLALIVVLVVFLLGFGAFAVRKWQRSNRACTALEAGKEAYQAQEWADAATYLGRYVSLRPNDVSVVLLYADAQLKKRPATSSSVQQAIGAFRQILRIQKGHVEAARRLTEIYLGTGNPGEAELIARRCIEANADPEIRRILAVSLLQQQKFEEAAEELKVIIADHPDQIAAYELMSQLTKQRPDISTQTPVQWLAKAVESNPDSALALIVYAREYGDSNEPAALELLDKAEQLDLSDVRVRLQLARALVDFDQQDRAMQHLEVVKATNPANQMLWQVWAKLALASGSKDTMARVAEEGLEHLADDPWDYIPVATELFIRADMLERASDCVSRLKDRDIAPAGVAVLEGLIAERKGRDYEAVKYWNRAIQLGNSSPKAKVALAMLLAKSGNVQSARKLLENLIREAPNSVDAHLAYARLLAKLGDWQLAAQHALTATRMAPENSEASLLYIKTQVELRAANAEPTDEKAWDDIEEQLSAMSQTPDDLLRIKLIQTEIAINQTKFDEAKKILEELERDYADELEVNMARVRLLIATDDTDKAIAELKDTESDFADTAAPTMALAVLLNEKGLRDECKSVLLNALRRIEGPLARRQLGLVAAGFYSEWQRPDDADKLLKTLIEEMPNDIVLKRRLLDMGLARRDPAAAQELIDDIKSITGDEDWQWRFEQARFWASTNEFEANSRRIVALLRENISENPGDQASLLLLATTYDRLGNLDMAISHYKRALERSPQNINIITPLISALFRAGEHEEGDALLDRTASGRFKTPGLQRLQSQSYVRRGQLQSAVAVLEKMLAADPNDEATALSLAFLRIRSGRYEQAGKLLNDLRENDPNSMAVAVARVELEIRRGDPNEAIAVCDEMIERLENAEAYLLRARAFASIDRGPEALADASKAVELAPENPDAWIAKSGLSEFMGDRRTAIEDIRAALSTDPNSLTAQKRAISLLMSAGDRGLQAQAEEILKRALKQSPDDIELMLARTRLLMAQATAPGVRKAVEFLHQITQKAPETPQAWVLLADIALDYEGNAAKALDIANRGLAHNSDNRELLLAKARAEAARSVVTSIPTLRTLHRNDPNDTEAVVRLASALVDAGDGPAAITLLHKQIDASNNDAARRTCNITLAAALHTSGRQQEANHLLESLLEEDPNDSALILLQARLLNIEGKYERIVDMSTDYLARRPEDARTVIGIAETLVRANAGGLRATGPDPNIIGTAEKLVRAVLKEDPRQSAALNLLALLLQSSGRSDEALECYEKVIALQPDNVVAMNNAAWIISQQQGNHRRALELANTGLEKAPHYVDLIDTRGVIYYHLREYEKSIADFKECLRLYSPQAPARVSSCFNLAKALAASGRRAKALEMLNEALDMNRVIETHRGNGRLSAADLKEAEKLRKSLSATDGKS